MFEACPPPPVESRRGNGPGLRDGNPLPGYSLLVEN